MYAGPIFKDDSDSSSSSFSSSNQSTPEHPPRYLFLALKGGGARGFIHLGVAIALKKMGLLDDLEMIAGSSAGAIAALLIATGWPIEDILAELNGLDLQSLIYQESPYTAPLRLHQSYGLHHGDALTAWFEKIIKKVTGKDNATFLDWHQKKEELDKAGSAVKMKHLYIEACNLNKGFNEEFSHTSQHNQVPIALAMRASMAYTGFFFPVKIKVKDKEVLYGDGGLQSDCPIMIFETIQGKPNPNMLAVWLDDLDRLKYIHHGTMPEGMEINSAGSALYAQMVALYNLQLIHLSKSQYKDKLIYCDTLGIGTLEFTLSDMQKDRLIQSGIYGVVRYFMKFYPEFTEQFFDPILIAHMQKLTFPLSLAEFEAESIDIDFGLISLNDIDQANSNHNQLKKVADYADQKIVEGALTASWKYLPWFSMKSEVCSSQMGNTSSLNGDNKEEVSCSQSESPSGENSVLQGTTRSPWCNII